MKRLSIVALLALITACERVDETEHCVATKYGNVTNKKVDPGLQVAPLTDFTCFSLTEQNYPSGTDGEGKPAKEIVDNAPTKDSTLISGDVALTWQYDPSTVFEVFTAKRSPDKVEFEIQNAVRDGFRSAVATVTIEDLLGPARASFDTVVKSAIQKKLGKIARVNKVFIRGIVLPQSLTAARERIVKQAADLREAQNKKQIAEANAAEKIANAKGEAESALLIAKSEAESRRLQATAYAESPKVIELEIAKAYAGLCGQATTCILGQSFLAGIPGLGGQK